MSESESKIHLHTKPTESPKKLAIIFFIALVVFVVGFILLGSFMGSSKSSHSAAVNPPASSSALKHSGSSGS